MMTSRRFGVLLVVAMLVGAAVAFLVPGPQTASAAAAAVRINPGPTYAWLTTSWHGTSGQALDWGHPNGGSNTVDTVVYWRSHSYRSDTSNATQIGSVSVSTMIGTTCKTVRARFTNSVGTATNADVNYVHTYISGTSFFYVFGRSTWYYQSYGISKISLTENDACKNQGLWDAPHLHQEPLYPFGASTWNYTTTGQWYSVTGLSEEQANFTFLF